MNSKQLLAYSIKYEGDYASISKALFNNEPYIHIKEEGFYFTICDDIYPESLKVLKNPPYVLYYRGNINLLKQV